MVKRRYANIPKVHQGLVKVKCECGKWFKITPTLFCEIYHTEKSCDATVVFSNKDIIQLAFKGVPNRFENFLKECAGPKVVCQGIRSRHRSTGKRIQQRVHDSGDARGNTEPWG